MKKYELIIFDCDGTLVESEAITNEVVAEMVTEYGIQITPEETLERFAGKTIMHIMTFIKESYANLDEKEFEREYRRRSLDSFRKNLLPVPGVIELLEKLSIPICVASNGPRMKMDVTLPVTGLDRFFDPGHIFSAYDIQKWKPDPDLFLHAADNMGVASEKVLVIEDTWSGVMGALNGRMDVWAYNPHGDPRILLDNVPNYPNMRSLGESLMYYI